MTDHWLDALFGDDVVSAVFSAEAELSRMLRVEAAWTRALGQVEGGTSDEIDRIAHGIETFEIEPNALSHGFARDGVVVPGLVTMLKEHLGGAAQPWIHRGLTSQDVTDTAMVLGLQEVMAHLAARMAELDTALGQLAQRFGAARITPFTRMQPALETSVRVVIERWQHPLKDVLQDWPGVAERAAIVQWGGPIGVRDHPRSAVLGAAFANTLGLRDVGRSWHTDRAVLSDVVNMMARASVVTGKLGEDTALMAATGSLALAGGASSAMPHKNNPVKAEALITLADLVVMHQTGLSRAARHEGFRSGQAWMLEWLVLPQMCTAVGAGVRTATQLINGIERLGNDT